MCGIIGYIGGRNAHSVLLHGLRRLEYRGYDSAGIAVVDGKNVVIERAVGKVKELEAQISSNDIPGHLGVGHTRWATHGAVTLHNTHPHRSGDVIVVHNGIIENYRELKEKIKNHEFRSDTDTEVLAALINQTYEGDLMSAVRLALADIRGTYGLAVIHADHPELIVVARMGSPLVIGVGENEFFVASDATPLIAYTKDMVFLDDGEIACIRSDGFEVATLEQESVAKDVTHIDWDDTEAQLDGYRHYMIKEIHEQPRAMLDAIRGRYDANHGLAHLGGLHMSEKEMRNIDNIVIVACGTAYHAGLVAKYWFENLAQIPVRVEVASEFRYRNPVVDSRTLVFAISQSGETADTLAAVREAQRRGAYVRGIVNVVGSTISRETEGGTHIHAGPEIAVASTKAFTNMIAVLFLYALAFGRSKNLSQVDGVELISQLERVPELLQSVINNKHEIKAAAERFSRYRNCLFIARGVLCPVAMEGSLKLKEISYIHSEATAAGEMKHGINALLDEAFPVVAVALRNEHLEKMLSNVEEARARKSPVWGFIDKDVAPDYFDFVVTLPSCSSYQQPFVVNCAFQLFAYYVADALGRDIDKPRNLAKSVTVE